MSIVETRFVDRKAACEAAPAGRLERTLQRIRSEFAEMPGLCLTKAQAERLWGLEPHECIGVLDALVAAKYLRLTARGYVRT